METIKPISWWSGCPSGSDGFFPNGLWDFFQQGNFLPLLRFLILRESLGRPQSGSAHLCLSVNELRFPLSTLYTFQKLLKEICCDKTVCFFWN